MEPYTLAPASKKQEHVLNSSSTITLAGGGAGGGKTFILLMVALKFMQDPHATGIIFRRTSKQLGIPGGLWSEAVTMYKAIYGDKIKIRHREFEFVFPNGAFLKFSHLEHEKNIYDHQGGQYSFVGFDEGTHFTQRMITYLMSRMRNTKVKYKPQMFISCNPDPDHFLRKWVDHCLDEDGVPIDEVAMKERYFVVQNDEYIWADKRSELEKIYGKGEDSGITSFSFTPIRCYDNPILLKNNPSYISNLKALGKIEELRLLHGSWTARAEGVSYVREDFFEVVETAPIRVVKRVRAWDLAMTEESSLNRDPDWSVGILMSKDSDKFYTIEGMERFRKRFAGVEQHIIETAIKDGRDTVIVIPLDPGAAGKAYAQTLQQKLAEYGFTVVLDRTTSSKLTRLGPFASMAEAGFVRIVRGEWNEQLFREMEAFDGDKNSGHHDDVVDSVASAFNKMKSTIEIPNFTLPSFDQSNPYRIEY